MFMSECQTFQWDGLSGAWPPCSPPVCLALEPAPALPHNHPSHHRPIRRKAGPEGLIMRAKPHCNSSLPW